MLLIKWNVGFRQEASQTGTVTTQILSNDKAKIELRKNRRKLIRIGSVELKLNCFFFLV